MKIKTETLSIRIEPKLKKAIQRRARKQKLSVANYVAQEMAEAVNRDK